MPRPKEKNTFFGRPDTYVCFVLTKQEYNLGPVRAQVVEGQYFISPPAALVLFGGALLREIPLMAADSHQTLATLVAEGPAFALSIALGTSINYLQFSLIQVPPLSLSLSASCFILSVRSKTSVSLNTTLPTDVL
jgi:hypothetical protein